jgi:type II secretion system protein N
MKLKLKVIINRYTLGVFAFAVAALIVMLYLRFPGHTLTRFLVSSASEKNPEMILLIDAAQPVIPPGIQFINLTLGFRDNPLSTIQADRAMISPAYLTLLKGRIAVAFSIDTYGGVVQGEAGMNHFLSFQGPVNGKISADGVNIEKIGYLKERLGRQVTGKLKGAMTFASPRGAIANGTGSFEFTLVNGSYQLLESIMGIDRLDFKKVEALMSLKNGVLTITKLKLMGEKAACTLSGDITLNPADIKSSQINLNAAIELPGQNNKKISMVLTGPLGNPMIKYT